VLSQRAPTTAVPRAKVGAIQSRVNAGRCLYAYRRQAFNRVDPGEVPNYPGSACQEGSRRCPNVPAPQGERRATKILDARLEKAIVGSLASGIVAAV
jgi:hypothetical protein